MTPERYLHDPHIQDLLQTTRMTRDPIGRMEISMARTYDLGRVAGLRLSTELSAIIASVFLWMSFSGVVAFAFGVPPAAAIAGGLAAVLLHWGSDIVHQLGHARVARATGHPMIGIRLWSVFSASVYPSDEGSLPAAIHIRRALGGPPASLLLTVIAAAIALALRPPGGVFWWLALFLFLDNLLVLTIGALLPLGFTDGSTLLRWWGKQS